MHNLTISNSKIEYLNEIVGTNEEYLDLFAAKIKPFPFREQRQRSHLTHRSIKNYFAYSSHRDSQRNTAHRFHRTSQIHNDHKNRTFNDLWTFNTFPIRMTGTNPAPVRVRQLNTFPYPQRGRGVWALSISICESKIWPRGLMKCLFITPILIMRGNLSGARRGCGVFHLYSLPDRSTNPIARSLQPLRIFFRCMYILVWGNKNRNAQFYVCIVKKVRTVLNLIQKNCDILVFRSVFLKIQSTPKVSSTKISEDFLNISLISKIIPSKKCTFHKKKMLLNMRD